MPFDGTNFNPPPPPPPERRRPREAVLLALFLGWALILLLFPISAGSLLDLVHYLFG
jgi:hypothetical protein